MVIYYPAGGLSSVTGVSIMSKSEKIIQIINDRVRDCDHIWKINNNPDLGSLVTPTERCGKCGLSRDIRTPAIIQAELDNLLVQWGYLRPYDTNGLTKVSPESIEKIIKEKGQVLPKRG